jgi:FKBP-type peptidyl-prolyl cis-trans isomerase SlyD
MQATRLASHPTLHRLRPELLSAPPRRISAGSVVTMRYTMSLQDGTVVEQRGEATPFAYLHGAGNVVAGLERELHNRTAGDRFEVTVAPHLGFGELDPSMVRRVPRKEFPPEAKLTAGMRFRSQLDDGTLLPARVTAIDSDSVTVSFNHPLAGETLHFSVEVVGVRDARPDELIHGHPHGPEGVQH